MKKVKDEAIINAVGRHLSKRNYADSDPLKKNQLRLRQSGAQFEKSGQRLSQRNRLIALQHCPITEDAADRQYLHFKAWVDSLDPVISTDVRPLLLPVFVSLYVRLAGSETFYQHHQQDHQTPGLRSTARQMLEDRRGRLRFTVEVSAEAFEAVDAYLSAGDHPLLLHLLNTCVELAVTESRLHEPSSPTPAQVPPSPVRKPVSEADPDTTFQAEQVQDLKAAIERLRCVPTMAPLLKLLTVDTGQRKMTSACLSPCRKKVACAFIDSSLAVWNLQDDGHSKPLATASAESSTSSLDWACSIGRLHPASTRRRDASDAATPAAGAGAAAAAAAAAAVPALAAGSATMCRGHSGPVYAAQFTASGHLISAGDDTTLRLWNTETMENAAVYRGHTYPVWSVDVCANDRLVASGSQDRTCKLWTLERTHPVRVLAGHLADVDCCVFHPNGVYVATGSADRTVRLWSVADGAMVRTLVAHRATVLALAFSPCGKLLASAGEDAHVKVWDVATNSVVHDLRGHHQAVDGLVWLSPHQLASSSAADGTVRLWNTQLAEPHGHAQAPLDHVSPKQVAAYTVPVQWKPAYLAATGRNQLVCVASSD